MKVTLINTSDTLGGAAIVTTRLMDALRNEGIDARMIVHVKNSDNPYITGISEKKNTYSFLAERAKIYYRNGFNREDLFKVSTASDGYPLHKHEWVKDADIIVLNWINQGLLSLKGIKKICQMGKPVIWTMHDMWCTTGICHHAHECMGYQSWCGFCPYKKNGKHENDLSRKVWEKKKKLYDNTSIHFVPVSSWLADKCQESMLMRGKSISVIHNALPVESFYTMPKNLNGIFGIDIGRSTVTMGAARLDDPIKGIEYAIEGLNKFAEKYPRWAKNTTALFFGNIRNPEIFKQLKIDYRHLGMITNTDDIRELYASSCVVLSTSLYETLPGTLIEGMAAGCIPVSFGQGGQCDIIDHKYNGYIADYKSAESIADGIMWAFTAEIERSELHEIAKERFSSQSIAQQYIALFNQLLSKK